MALWILIVDIFTRHTRRFKLILSTLISSYDQFLSEDYCYNIVNHCLQHYQLQPLQQECMCVCLCVSVCVCVHVCLPICLPVCTYVDLCCVGMFLPIYVSILCTWCSYSVLLYYHRSKLIAKTQSLFKQTKSPPVRDAEMVTEKLFGQSINFYHVVIETTDTHRVW